MQEKSTYENVHWVRIEPTKLFFNRHEDNLPCHRRRRVVHAMLFFLSRNGVQPVFRTSPCRTNYARGIICFNVGTLNTSDVSAKRKRNFKNSFKWQ